MTWPWLIPPIVALVAAIGSFAYTIRTCRAARRECGRIYAGIAAQRASLQAERLAEIRARLTPVAPAPHRYDCGDLKCQECGDEAARRFDAAITIDRRARERGL